METLLKVQNSSSIGFTETSTDFAPGICYSRIVNLPSFDAHYCYFPFAPQLGSSIDEGTRHTLGTKTLEKSWQRKMDDPLEIFNTAADLHTEMINQMKGVPENFTGVTQERLVEGLSAMYCALSLVGEPIMYLEISIFLDELQKRRISTLLVTNDSLTALKEKKQQTVYCLTIVKGWNREDVDVFSEALTLKSEGEYEGLCEHAHSCSVLSKTRKFKVNVLLYTWWLQEDLSTARIIWLSLHPGPSMEPRKVDIIPINPGTGKSDIKSEKVIVIQNQK
ncbi:hypothetical protein GOBAR_AA06214 [Gossypium barbadense]|uniref:Uncharacterized protein n=1 Tax=Gossypium barbadense TaxID=3634 RepID=A0A2P5YFK7_GOSBA|nr:hypothetical protein GOBAR_AA06214 [Gossypium barbadense]